jgi:hypothetical protein
MRALGQRSFFLIRKEDEGCRLASGWMGDFLKSKWFFHLHYL